MLVANSLQRRGVRPDIDEETSGSLYRKISRDLTLMLQEALLHGAVKFEYDATLGLAIAVTIINQDGERDTVGIVTLLEFHEPLVT